MSGYAIAPPCGEGAGGGNPTNRAYKPQPHQPAPREEKNHPERPHNPDGGTTPAGNHSNTGKPNPTAKATDDHDPDPKPPKQARALRDGNRPAGQGPPGNATNKPPIAPGKTGPKNDGSSDETSAAERPANAPRPRPHRPEATEKTEAAGHRRRKTASAPPAHPTNTGRPAGTAAAAAAATAGGGATEREPQNATAAEEATTKAAATGAGSPPPTAAHSGKPAAGGATGTDTNQPDARRRTAQNGRPNATAAARANNRAARTTGNTHTPTQPDGAWTDGRNPTNAAPAKAAREDTDRKGAGENMGETSETLDMTMISW